MKNNKPKTFAQIYKNGGFTRDLLKKDKKFTVKNFIFILDTLLCSSCS